MAMSSSGREVKGNFVGGCFKLLQKTDTVVMEREVVTGVEDGRGGIVRSREGGRCWGEGEANIVLGFCE